MISGTLKKYIMSRIISANAMVYINNNATTQSIPNGTAWTKLTLPNAVIGFSKHIILNAETREVIIKKKGKYQFAFNFSSLSSVGNVILETVLLKNDTEVVNMHMSRQFSGLAVLSHGTLTGIVDLEKGDVLRIGVRHNNGSPINFKIQYGNICTHKI